MTDPRPSIAELQRIEREHPDHPTHALLLEIAATGLLWAAAEDALAEADSTTARVSASMRASSAFDRHRAVLSKVRP